ncbi:MAG TPA: winged helix-turn-helix transcriptional regulator [Nitrososphaerales archaeon]|nr:winged helix-turn-helix transcriptional regulator [Nitrososphaerales archaeon]
MKLDPIDLIILRELSQDGRASLRQIAVKSSLSTPTVSSRFERMKRAGLIQKFVPVLNLDASDNSGLVALATLTAPSSDLSVVARDLARMPEVCGVFLTTGANNLMIKLSVPSAQALQRFLTGPRLRKLNIEVASSQIVTETIKDEHPLPFAGEFQMKLSCDLCKGDITTSRPYSIKVASTRYYFCCKTCRSTYLEKHKARIQAVNRRSQSDTLHL